MCTLEYYKYYTHFKGLFTLLLQAVNKLLELLGLKSLESKEIKKTDLTLHYACCAKSSTICVNFHPILFIKTKNNFFYNSGTYCLSLYQTFTRTNAYYFSLVYTYSHTHCGTYLAMKLFLLNLYSYLKLILSCDLSLLNYL